ncbi:MAG: type II toxin-antitoxin system VapC family toxin [Actinomycetes bacterium]
MQYVDSSALAKIYVREPDSGLAIRLLDADADWVTAAITEVEVRRVIALRLSGEGADRARSAFLRDWERLAVVAADATTIGRAATIAESTRARSLAAMHLASAARVSSRSLRLVTFDVRLAATARSLGFAVVGA